MPEMATPYIGSKISLISKSEIRYEGILYTIDPKESTIALAKVRCFGTESRVPASSVDPAPVPPRDEIYEYIIFKASDIKDLTVCETPQPAPNIYANAGLPHDPAILSASKETSATGHMNPQAAVQPDETTDAASQIESADQQVKGQLNGSKTETTASQTNRQKRPSAQGTNRRQSTGKRTSGSSKAQPMALEDRAPGAGRQKKATTGADEKGAERDRSGKDQSKRSTSNDRTNRNRRQRDRERESSTEAAPNRRRRSPVRQDYANQARQSPNMRRQQQMPPGGGYRRRFYNNDDQQFGAIHFGAGPYPPPMFAAGPPYGRGGMRGGYRGGRGGGFVPVPANMIPYMTPPHMGNQPRFRRYDLNPMMPYQQRGPMRYNNNRAYPAQKFDSDYDFEKANEEFLSGKLAKMGLLGEKPDEEKKDTETQISDTSAASDTAALQQNNDAAEEEEKPHENFYDRSVSFFDRISCESLERQAASNPGGVPPQSIIEKAAKKPTDAESDANATTTTRNYVNQNAMTSSSSRINPRAAWRHERELNQLTFGVAALAPRRGGYNRRVPPLMAMQMQPWAAPPMNYRPAYLPRGAMAGGRFR